MARKKVVIVGWDAADWKLIGPLLQAGRMPALARILKDGVHGNLSTLNPPYSPMLWTSIATGMTPDKHGVLGFIEIDAEAQRVRPVTSTQRKVRALWNILHNQGLKTNLVSWWPSHPTEPINGAVVSDKYVKPTVEYGKPWPIPPGSLHPESLRDELADLRVHPAEITSAHILPFMPRASEIDQEDSKALLIFSKIVAENASTHACGTWLMENTDWDVTAVYYDMIDHFCHSFMKFHPPKLPNIKESDFELYKDVINSVYQFQDMMLDRTLQLAGDDALVLVLSDHGFVSDQNRMLVTPDMQAAPSLEHGEFGIITAMGPGVKKGEKIFGASILDITPTILHYLGLPVGTDMDGRVIKDMFTEDRPVEYISSWEDMEGDFAQLDGLIKDDPLSEQAAMEQLVELGYIDRPNSTMEKAIQETKCELRFNLARVHMGKREYDLAKPILRELTGETDVNIVPFVIDLLHIAIIEKDYDAARRYLEQIRELDPKALMKTRVAEAKILLGEGHVDSARKLLNEISAKEHMAGPAHFELGRLFLQIELYKEALGHFTKAVEFKPDNAKYQHALAVAHLRLGRPEEALDHALVSVELVRYFPDAHYTIGEALEKLGDLENAKVAYDTAARLGKDMTRAKMAKAKLSTSDLPQQKKQVDGLEQFPEVVIVSGLPRSGTSMMMQMLDAGGMEALTDGKRAEDDDNPKGYFEYEKVKSLHKSNDWMPEAEGKVVKVIAHLLKYLPIGYRYKVVFMDRDLDEVLASQETMLKRNNRRASDGVDEAFRNELIRVDRWAESEPGVEMLKVSYSDVVKNPGSVAREVSRFLGRELDLEKMVAKVDPSLYRNRAFQENQE